MKKNSGGLSIPLKDKIGISSKENFLNGNSGRKGREVLVGKKGLRKTLKFLGGN